MDEHILVIKRSSLTSEGSLWQGLTKRCLQEFHTLVQQEKEFHPRSSMETDETYKQIIPYLVFKYQHRYFLMQRTAHASEQRLKNKYSLGIGGHVRQDDLLRDSSLLGWAQREFDEEVSYQGSYEVKPLGLLNDDSDSVGRVHLGYVLLLEGDSDAISIRSELKSGELRTLQEIQESYSSLERWSQLVVDVLAAL